MAKYIMKPKVIEAITFDELMDYGRTQTDNVYNGMPWSFTYKGSPVTHETDECYKIGTISFTKNDMLMLKNKSLSVMKIEEFIKYYEKIEEDMM